jgi:reverse gyrase
VKLIIVESPAKAKALQGFLGREYKALAPGDVSPMGHIRDLPYKKLGVDVEHGFRPTYWFRRGGNKQAKRIEDAARKAEAVYVATDPDREGEAIGWHSGDVSQPLKVGTCPKCGGDLVERRAKQGIYWGCLNYLRMPCIRDCRYRVRPTKAKEQEV